MNKIEGNILSAIAYFDVFNYPLNLNEIRSFTPINIQNKEIEASLNHFYKQKVVEKAEDYFGNEDIKNKVSYRKETNERALQSLPIAKQMGLKIARFPFIKSVFISGSLSKNVMHKNSDFDFFIITSKNRIWFSKLFLKCYKFFFLKNSKSNFCVNYMIAENELEIPDKNLFTATEIATLIQVSKSSIDKDFYSTNDWWKRFLPNYILRVEESAKTNKKSKTVSLIEKLCSGKFGNFIDNFILNLNHKRNDKVYAQLKKDKDYELMMRSNKNASKSHASNHQNKVLQMHQQKLNALKLKLNESLINQ